MRGMGKYKDFGHVTRDVYKGFVKGNFYWEFNTFIIRPNKEQLPSGRTEPAALRSRCSTLTNWATQASCWALTHRCTGRPPPPNQNEVEQVINVIQAKVGGNNFKKKTYMQYSIWKYQKYVKVTWFRLLLPQVHVYSSCRWGTHVCGSTAI
jgi:hypothetical protein